MVRYISGVVLQTSTHSIWIGEVAGICEPAAEVVVCASPIIYTQKEE